MPLMVGPALIGVARLRSRMDDPRLALDAVHDGIAHSVHMGYRPVVVEVLGASTAVLLRLGELACGTVLGGSLLQGALPSINTRSESRRRRR